MKFIRKNIMKKKRKSKGVAMIATLFTIAIVLTLGVSFLMLAISESRTTRVEKESIMALQTANAGAELVLNYMSESGSDIWEKVRDSSSFKIYYLLREYSEEDGEVNHFREDYLGETVDVNIEWAMEPEDIASNGGQFVYNFKISPNRIITPDRQYVGKYEVQVLHKNLGSQQPDQFIIYSTGKVYRNLAAVEGNLGFPAGEEEINIELEDEPVAMRRIEMLVRDKTACDNLQFFQNALAYDLPGNGVAPPNANEGSNSAVGISAGVDNNTGQKGYQANGPITIDGNSDFATETAGYMQFFDVSEDIKFFGPVSTYSTQDDSDDDGENIYPESAEQENIQAMFKSDVYDGQASKGLPDREGFMSVDLNGDGEISTNPDDGELGYAVKLAKDNSGTNDNGESYVDAYYQCGDNDGLSTDPGVVGHSKADDPTQWEDEWGVDPDDPNFDPNDDMSKDVPADVEFDGLMLNSKPGFATYKVKFFDDGTLTLTKTTAYTEQTTTLLSRVSLDRFKNGVLVIEGGNVEVEGTCEGQLSVIATEHPTREAYAYEIKTTDGETITQYASTSANMANYFNDPSLWVPGKLPGEEIEKVVQKFSKVTTYNPQSDKNADHIYVPYDDERLPERVEDGELGEAFDRVPPYKIDGHWVWPGESSINDTIQNVTAEDGGVTAVYNDIEREGNITICNDLGFTSDSNNSLALISKNYILLNDDRIEEQINSGEVPQLDVRAVLMSFDHSVQFDDVNLSGKDTWISQPNMNGNFNFKGSMIGQFADVEGKTDGTGYINQSFEWDPNLKNSVPPHFPKWDKTRYGSGVTDPSRKPILEYVVLSYQDRSGLKDEKDEGL